MNFAVSWPALRSCRRSWRHCGRSLSPGARSCPPGPVSPGLLLYAAAAPRSAPEESCAAASKNSQRANRFCGFGVFFPEHADEGRLLFLCGRLHVIRNQVLDTAYVDASRNLMPSIFEVNAFLLCPAVEGGSQVWLIGSFCHMRNPRADQPG